MSVPALYVAMGLRDIPCGLCGKHHWCFSKQLVSGISQEALCVGPGGGGGGEVDSIGQ